MKQEQAGTRICGLSKGKGKGATSWYFCSGAFSKRDQAEEAIHGSNQPNHHSQPVLSRICEEAESKKVAREVALRVGRLAMLRPSYKEKAPVAFDCSGGILTRVTLVHCNVELP